ncbi:MAG: hypothetical protein HW398_1004 [Acidobacteria bacterium]|nr:hypothetical protein [Acidobacteriota bacterium]
MTNYRPIEQTFSDHLHLQQRPVAVIFRDAPPAGVARFAGTVPSGCSFWRLAAEGRSFYTVPADHYNCPIGSYTHNIPLPENRAQELDQTLGLMVQIGYVRMEEVPGIPRLPKTPGAVVYAPLGDSSLDPDVVLFAGRPGSVMLLQEAAQRAGVAAQWPLFGRPTCMALPFALAHGAVASTGCIGNRVYTDLGEGELYLAVPGRDIARVAQELQTIASANAQLLAYHKDRKQKLTAV